MTNDYGINLMLSVVLNSLLRYQYSWTTSDHWKSSPIVMQVDRSDELEIKTFIDWLMRKKISLSSLIKVFDTQAQVL